MTIGQGQLAIKPASSTTHKSYLRNGIGNKSEFDAMFAAIEHEIYTEVTFTPEEIMQQNLEVVSET
jgi:hypothetical protein